LKTEIELNQTKEDNNNNKRKNSKNGEDVLRKQLKTSEDQ